MTMLTWTRVFAAGFLAFMMGTPLALAESGSKSESAETHKSQGMKGQGMMKGHGMMKKGPKLKVEIDGKGREIEFECHDTMNECLKAYDHVTKSFD